MGENTYVVSASGKNYELPKATHPPSDEVTVEKHVEQLQVHDNDDSSEQLS